MIEPLFSVVTPVYRTPLRYLRKMIRSVVAQGWPSWELILIDDHSDDDVLSRYLHNVAEKDQRIRVITRGINGGISAASNDGVEAACGEFIVLLDHDDVLAPGALRLVAKALAENPLVDYLYTDEDKIDEYGTRYDAFRKPDWSPERLRGQMYTGHLSVLRTSLVREVGGFNTSMDGSQDHDLVLRVTEKARAVHHIPKMLYRWRSHRGSTAASAGNKPYTWDAGVRAVNAHLERIASIAVAERGPVAGTYSISRPLAPSATISVIIPTRGSGGVVFGRERVFVVEAVRSVLGATEHKNVEIVVVHDDDTPQEVLQDLRVVAGERLVLVPFVGPFNFSAKCNLGFVRSSGEYIVMMNDDMEAISDRPLETLVAPLVDSSVGMTGAYLFFEDGTLQHAGHRYADRGYHHAYLGAARRGDPGYFSALLIDREVSGLTAAFIAMRRETYVEVGGFNGGLPGNFNDVDLSMKVAGGGYRLVWLNGVQLYHFESKTREGKVHSWEVKGVRRRWGVPRDDMFIR